MPRSPGHIMNLLKRIPKNIDWDAVALRAESHPDEVESFRGMPFNKITLHVMVLLQPTAKAVRAVARAFPDALAMDYNPDIPPFMGMGGMTPLVLAYRCGADNDIIRTLLQETRRAITENTVRDPHWRKLLDTPVLLEECRLLDPAFTTELFRLCLEELPPIDISQLSPKENGFSFAYLFLDATHEHDAASWEKINLLLMSSSMGTVNENELNGRRFLFLHTFLEMILLLGPFENHVADLLGRESNERDLNSIMRILKIIRELAPDQFRSRDDTGSLALHVASKTKYNGVDKQEKTTKLVRFLLEEYPESTRVSDGQGRLSLHIAAEHGAPFTEVLADAEPRALTTRCPVTHMYPFQLAAISSHMDDSSSKSRFDEDDSSVEGDSSDEDDREATNIVNTQTTSIVYTLLRKAPDVLQSSALAADPWMDTQEFKEIQRNCLKMAQLAARNVSLKRKRDEMLGS